MRSQRCEPGRSFLWGYILPMQINLDKKSGLLLGIIAGLLVVIIVLLVDKVGDEGNFIETHSTQLQIGN
jgi:hypothetical protein